MKKSVGGAAFATAVVKSSVAIGESKTRDSLSGNNHCPVTAPSKDLTPSRGGGVTGRGEGGGIGEDQIARTHWCLQSLHTDSKLNGESGSPSENEATDGTRMNDLSRIYFPYTLATTSASGSRLPPATSVVYPGTGAAAATATGNRRRINSAGSNQGHQKSRSSHRTGRSGSGVSSSSSASTNSFDRIQSQEDSRTGTHKVLLSSPFESALTQLRLDRLRIEEEHLLEVKRQEELERTRGPLLNWYSMKSSQFGRELRKHNDILKTKNSRQELIDYRATLERASKQFKNSFYSDSQ